MALFYVSLNLSRQQFNNFNADSNDYVSWQEIVDYYKLNASVNNRLDNVVDVTLKKCDRNGNKAIDRFEIKEDDCWEELEIRLRFDTTDFSRVKILVKILL